MPFKLEYRLTDHSPWNVKYCGSLIFLSDEAKRLRAQGWEVRCLNDIGQDILGLARPE